MTESGALRPWPGDADRVVSWIRSSLQAPLPDGEFEIEGLDRISIALDLRGTDVERFVIDARSAALRIRRSRPSRGATVNSADPASAGDPGVTATTVPAPTSVAADTATPAVLSRTPARADLVRVTADPVLIEGQPVSVDAQLEDVPFDWVVYAEPAVRDQPDSRYGVEPSDPVGLRGAVSVSMRTDDLAPLLAAAAAPLLEEAGVVLRRLRIDVDQDGSDGIRASAEAAVRWKLLRASARGRIRLTVTPDGVVTVRDLRVGSRNPVIALALRAARRQVSELIGRTVDLNAELGGGPRLHDVRLSAGDELRASARLG